MEKVNDRELTTPQVAQKLGIKPRTWTGYKSRPPKGNPVPEPDGHYGPATPWWWESTIDAWEAGRPGAGARTDIKRKQPEPQD